MVPGTCQIVQIFPTRIRLEEGAEIPLEITGPVEGFTAALDLEKGCVIISGFGREGFKRHTLFVEQGSLILKGKNTSQEILKLRPAALRKPSEQLSLGVHKKQEWEQVVKRGNLNELFPFWLRASQWMPSEPSDESIQTNDSDFQRLFRAGFSGMLCPELEDTTFSGYSLPNSTAQSPFSFLVKTGHMIRSLFFREEGQVFSVLPSLPSKMHCGRYIGIETKEGDRLDIEWSKKCLRRLVLTPKTSRVIQLKLQKEIKTYRVRASRKDRGKMLSLQDPLVLKQGEPLFLDRFQR